MHLLITYLLSAMMSWAPPANHAYYESKAETTERYESIAHDIAAVVLDPAEAPLFGGPQGRAQTGLLLAAIASYESGGYRRDVDFGMGTRSRGDAGRSWCLMQINIGEGSTAEHWTGRDLVLDRQKCLRVGLHLVRASFGMCHSERFFDRLSGYTKGRCIGDEGASHRRMKRATEWWAAHKLEEDMTGDRTQAMAP
jgi:hypothetical protein